MDSNTWKDEMSFLDAERGLNEEIRKVQQNRYRGSFLFPSTIYLFTGLTWKILWWRFWEIWKRDRSSWRGHTRFTSLIHPKGLALKSLQDLERLLAEQRNNTTSLRGDVQNLTQQQQETEAEIQRCRCVGRSVRVIWWQRFQTEMKFNGLKLLAKSASKKLDCVNSGGKWGRTCIEGGWFWQNPRSHLSSEYDMLMRKERLRIEYMEQTQALNKQAVKLPLPHFSVH